MSGSNKCVFSKDGVVIGISEIYSEDASANVANGEILDVVSIDEVVSVGFTRSEVGGAVKFFEPVAFSNVGAGGGKQRPPEEA